MTVSSMPLMVEVGPTPAHMQGARCADCKAPIGIMVGRAFRGVDAEGQFLLFALCVECAERERRVVNLGLNLPPRPVYRRRSAYTLIGIATLAALIGLACVGLSLAGTNVAVAAAIATPFALLFAPGLHLYSQGCVRYVKHPLSEK